MAHRKDYRKTPAQNYREGINTEEDKPKHLKEWLIMGVIALFLLGGIVWFSNQLTTIPTVTTEEKKEKVATKAARKAKKKYALAESYEEVMILGDLGEEMEDHTEAANRYFDAKTIYPYKLEPRIALTETFFKRCKAGRDYYCLRTARELTYAYMQVNDATTPELVKQLDVLQSELAKIYTVKDSAMLYVH